MLEHSNIFKSEDGAVEVELRIKAECSTTEDMHKTIGFIMQSARKFYLQTAEKFNNEH